MFQDDIVYTQHNLLNMERRYTFLLKIEHELKAMAIVYLAWLFGSV